MSNQSKNKYDIGILGGGQLAQMLNQASHHLGITTLSFESTQDCPASITGNVLKGDVSNIDDLISWSKQCSTITYEFENFPANLINQLNDHFTTPIDIYPSLQSLAATQNRLKEKQFLTNLGITIAPFKEIKTIEELDEIFIELGKSIIVKTCSGGYDGKGQIKLEDNITEKQKINIADLLSSNALIAEQKIDFDAEVSIIATRDKYKNIVTYPLTHNIHRDGILHTSTPLKYSAIHSESSKTLSISNLEKQAFEIAQKVMNHLDYIGTIAIELFIANNQIIANEIAPRVHNSGHWTIEGAVTSQFENHMRAISGLPLGDTSTRCPVAMINLVGSVPPIEQLMSLKKTNVHLYGKSARPGRKLGHITINAETTEELNQLTDNAYNLINKYWH